MRTATPIRLLAVISELRAVGDGRIDLDRRRWVSSVPDLHSPADVGVLGAVGEGFFLGRARNSRLKKYSWVERGTKNETFTAAPALQAARSSRGSARLSGPFAHVRAEPLGDAERSMPRAGSSVEGRDRRGKRPRRESIERDEFGARERARMQDGRPQISTPRLRPLECGPLWRRMGEAHRAKAPGSDARSRHSPALATNRGRRTFGERSSAGARFPGGS